MNVVTTEFKDRLTSLNMLRENYIPYMISWVKHFHSLDEVKQVFSKTRMVSSVSLL